ncbi:MAG: nitrate reductase molybdenum cofactor assembly chaperone [Methyloligella sp.]|nr:MAG: nitrate reductase molybdenum cofactor assembly chaperone [Methyloligella sp.]
MKTFKILGLLLTYPEGSVLKAHDELLQAIQDEAILPKGAIKKIEHFIDVQNNKELLEIQEDYVDLFDRGRAHCLHLFEHIHGESRDRGQAMVDLIETYKSKGVYIDNNELPDYLPLFMEYLSHCSFHEASDLLGDAIDVIAVIGKKLEKRGSIYAEVFSAIEVLSSVKPDKTKIAQAIAEAPKDPETLEELDEEWKEAEAFSGDPVADCNSCNAFPNATEALNKQMGGA